MCFVCANFFLLGMRFTLEKGGKKERKGKGYAKKGPNVGIEPTTSNSAAHVTTIELHLWVKMHVLSRAGFFFFFWGGGGGPVVTGSPPPPQ